MRLNEFDRVIAQRDVDVYQSTLPEPLLKYIATYCSEYLVAAKDAYQFLYHGTQDHVEDFFIASTVDGRRPLNSDPDLQSAFDLAAAKHGFKTRRSNCIFTSGDTSEAQNYGRAYVIFPINGFDILWSPYVKDFFSKYSGLATPNSMEYYITKDEYKDFDLVRAIGSMNEVMIHGKFVGVKYHFVKSLKDHFIYPRKGL